MSTSRAMPESTTRVTTPLAAGRPSAAGTGLKARIDVSVVLPAWNEPESVRRLVPRLAAVLSSRGLAHEILVVVASAGDPTLAAAEEAGATAVVQREPGYGGALRDGLRAARGEFVATLDADLSHDPEALVTLLAARDRADIVLASRYVRFAFADMSPTRKLLSLVLNRFYRWLLSVPYRDLSSGFRLYRRRVLDEIQSAEESFAVLPEILVRAHAHGLRIVEVPFHYRPRAAGRSHARILRFGLAFLRTALALWRLRFSIFSADYDERAFFSRIPLQRYWQRRRYRIILGFLEEGSRILDIGCGTSMIIMALPRAVGLDLQVKKLRYLRQLDRRLVQGVLRRLPFREAAFDQVICSQVIEHIPEEGISFEEMARVLTPGGVLVIGTPDYGGKTWPLIERLYKVVMPGGYADEHVTHFDRPRLTAELDRAGFDVEDVKYILGGEMILKARRRKAP